MAEAPDSRLAAILDRLVEQHGWQQAKTITAIKALWRDIVGETIDNHTHILTLTSDGVLLIAVPSSVWSQEILYYKPRILDGLSRSLGVQAIKDVRTRVRSGALKPRALSQDNITSPYFRVERTTPTTCNLHELFARVQEKYERAARGWLREGFQPCAQCHAPTPQAYSLCVVCELERRRKS